MPAIAPQRDHEKPVLSVLREVLNRSARSSCRLGLLLAAMASSAPAYAILGCQTGAGLTVGGASDVCAPLSGKFEAAAVSDHGRASVSSITGSMSGDITVAPATISDGRFYGELIAEFRINGPASGSVPVDFIFSTHGSISGDCTNCEADVGYSHRISSVTFPGFQMRTSAVRTRTSDWLVSSIKSDTSGLSLNPTASGSTVDDTTSGVLSFDAAKVLGHTFRLTANLSGHAHLTGPNLPDAILTVDASHTALFNILLPAGYTLTAEPSDFSFLTAPILLAVPEPSTYALMVVGLGLVGVAARRRMRT